MAEACLVDTNVLLRFVKPDDLDYSMVCSVLAQLWTTDVDLCYTSQNLGEFWNTCTRPLDRNGYGLSISETDRRAKLIESRFRLLPDTAAVHKEWRRLVVSHFVSGVQVHDARIAAALHVHGVASILTFNGSDFARYPGTHVADPRRMAAKETP